MKKSIFLFTLLCIIGLNSQCICPPKDRDETLICYEFDQKQCGGDEWAEDIPLNLPKADREAKMKDYLSGKGISLDQVVIVEDFHEFVCEACNVCPEADRFFVKLDENDLEKLEGLDLLNLSASDCNEVF